MKEIAEYGHAKVDTGAPIFNYAVAYDTANREPLFYEEYPGSVNDVSQLEFMLDKAAGYGYKKVAYLFRVDGKYLLVPNKRTHKHQPVGGAYKFDEREARYLAENILVENDDRIPVDRITKRDYRLLVKSKDLKSFMKRFVLITKSQKISM